MCVRHTGQLPAIEKGAEIGGLEGGRGSAAGSGPAGRPGPETGALGEFRAARLCIDFARRHSTDLDQHLSAPQRAELMAYQALMQTRLEVATTLSAWCEPLGFAEVRKAMKQLPFPLGYVIPWSQQREVRRKYGSLDAAEVGATRSACSSVSVRWVFDCEPKKEDLFAAGLHRGISGDLGHC